MVAGDRFHLRIHRWHIFQVGFTNITEHGNADFQCHDRHFGVIILFYYNICLFRVPLSFEGKGTFFSMPYILHLIIYMNILIEDCSCAAPDHARHEPTPSQTKLHVAQRVRPARKNIILAKKLQKNVDF